MAAERLEDFLRRHEAKDLLRFITCGSVDDGKSTLIGRLLYDSKMIFEDQLAALENDSKKVVDFSLRIFGAKKNVLCGRYFLPVIHSDLHKNPFICSS